MPQTPGQPTDPAPPATDVAPGVAARRTGDVAVVAAVALAIAALSFYALTPRAAVVSCVLGWSMLAIAAIDARRFIVPDALSLPAIPLGLLASGSLLDPELPPGVASFAASLVSLDHAVGALVGGGAFWLVREAYWRLRAREGLGFGDVKLAAVAGAWTGWQDLPNVVLLAAATALALVLARALLRGGRLSPTDRIPFGTFLAPAIWVVWVVRVMGQGL